jgi:hypothetical protein
LQKVAGSCRKFIAIKNSENFLQLCQLSVNFPKTFSQNVFFIKFTALFGCEAIGAMNLTGTMNNEDLIKKIVRLMQTDDSADAPAEAVQWSKNLFRARAAEPKKSLVQKILAVLAVDLAPNKAVFGERSASASPVRQMLFAAGDHRIDLRILKVNKGFKVSGQILGESFAGAEIRLFNEGKNFIVKSNELSEFSFEKISKGKYTLSLIFKDKEIIVENIEID